MEAWRLKKRRVRHGGPSVGKGMGLISSRSAGDAPLEDGKSDRKTIGKKRLEMERLDRKRLEKRGLEELRLYRKWRILYYLRLEQRSNCYLFVSCQAAPLFD